MRIQPVPSVLSGGDLNQRRQQRHDELRQKAKVHGGQAKSEELDQFLKRERTIFSASGDLMQRILDIA